MKTQRRPVAFPKNLLGKELTTAEGVRFRVRDGQFYPHEVPTKQHAVYLNSLRKGLLVSVLYHGYPVPLVTVESGVFRLERVSIGTEVRALKGATAISKALGVVKPKRPVEVSPV